MRFHHRKSPTRREQTLNLCRIWIYALLNEAEIFKNTLEW